MSLLTETVDAELFGIRFRLEEADEATKSLVTKAVSGDKEALGALFDKLRPQLRRVVRARTSTMQDADIDDVLADVWLNVVESGLTKFKQHPEGLVAYLFVSVKNRALNIARGQRRGAMQLEPESEPAKTPSGGLSDAAKKVVRQAVARALEKAELSPEERAIVQQLFAVKGETLKLPEYGADIAAAKAAGLSGKTGKLSSTVTRAKQKFLRQFCSDPELCALIPSGRARTGAARIPGLGANVCKDVPDSCVEEFARRLDDAVVPGAAENAVLSWLTEVLTSS